MLEPEYSERPVMQQRLRVENLCRRYRDTVALDDVTLTAFSGEACGVFGPSGSGKSVLLRIIAGIEAPDSGVVSRRGSGCALSFAEPAVDLQLTPYETLWLHAILYEIPRRKRHAAVREVLVLMDLDSVRDIRVSSLSSGMRKRLELARALIATADILLLDEPTFGLDARMRERLWDRLLSLRSNEGRTVVIATSRPDDAELCDRINLLHHGRVLACGTVAQLRSMVGPEAVVIKPLDAKKAGTKGLRRNKAGITAFEQEGSLVVEMGMDSTPVELIRQISGDVAAVRLRPQGLGTVLDELAAQAAVRKAKDAE